MACRPEIELLLCSARTRLDAWQRERLGKLLRGEIDWEYLLRAADGHGVLPLLYRGLKVMGPAAAPATIIESLRQYYYSHAQRNLFLTGELLRLLQLLEANGIPALPYKGPMLALSAYGDVSLRTFADLDILLRKEDMIRAKDLLVSQGYLARTQLTRARERAHLRSPNQKGWALISRDGAVKVDLHWAFEREILIPLNPDRLWGRLEEIHLCGQMVRQLPPGELLIILCMHGAKHFFSRLEWVCDIAELGQRHARMDWEEIVRQAGELGAKRMLFLGLFLASELLGMSLPKSIRQEIQANPHTQWLATQVCQSLFQEHGGGSLLAPEDAHRVNLRDQAGDRLRFRWYFYLDHLHRMLMPNEQDKRVLRVPQSLSFIYYLLRPIRLAKIYAPILFAQIVKQKKP